MFESENPEEGTDNWMSRRKQSGAGGAAVGRTILVQRIVIGCLAAVVVIGGVTAGVGISQGWFSGGAGASSEVGASLDENAKPFDGQVGNAPKANPEAESISIPGYPKLYLTAGSTAADVVLGNPEGNPCYFTYELVLEDTEETLYQSGQIAPGEAVPSIELSRALEAGEYPAVLKITTNHVETQAQLNGANVKTVLVVE